MSGKPLAPNGFAVCFHLQMNSPTGVMITRGEWIGIGGYSSGIALAMCAAPSWAKKRAVPSSPWVAAWSLPEDHRRAALLAALTRPPLYRTCVRQRHIRVVFARALQAAVHFRLCATVSRSSKRLRKYAAPSSSPARLNVSLWQRITASHRR